MTEAILERWLEEVVATPGLTAITDRGAGSVAASPRMRSRAAAVVRGSPGPVVDVGSGGGSPGIPLALELPERQFTLLEAERRKCAFLNEVGAPSSRTSRSSGDAPRSRRWTPGAWPSRRPSRSRPVAAELCLPLVRPGGARDPVGGRDSRPGRGWRRLPHGSAPSSSRGPWACSCSASSARRRRGSRVVPAWRRSARSPRRLPGWAMCERDSWGSTGCVRSGD